MTERVLRRGRGGEFSALNRTVAEPVRVWDRFVRVFHWSQAALIAICWLTGDELKTVHEAAGYTVAGLLLLRVVWGFIGSRHARFADFVRRPDDVRAYLGQMLRGAEPRHLGHNPAGGAMVVALMLIVAATALTGWLQTTDAFWGSSVMEEIHEAFANLILVLVALHLAGVVLASLRHRENLVHSMIDGMKRPLDADTES